MKIIKVEDETRSFKEVKHRKATVADSEKAAVMAGTQEGVAFAKALLSLTCTFDGETLPMEELDKMSIEDFLELLTAMGLRAS
ncbi:MAG: hypothetical protein PHE67_02665 [Campylobacterales bacterium]|nr:hypothetical protein [Campylobacterales bacterium]